MPIDPNDVGVGCNTAEMKESSWIGRCHFFLNPFWLVKLIGPKRVSAWNANYVDLCPIFTKLDKKTEIENFTIGRFWLVKF